MEVLAKGYGGNYFAIHKIKYMYQINTLYTLNLHNVICQLYLNNAGGKKEICE